MFNVLETSVVVFSYLLATAFFKASKSFKNAQGGITDVFCFVE